jgi:subtilisin family serine protease
MFYLYDERIVTAMQQALTSAPDFSDVHAVCACLLLLLHVVLQSNTATYKSIRTAISTSITQAAADGMDILNLSYGQYSLNPSTEDTTALAAAVGGGTMAVAAAGNDGIQAGLFTTSYPSYDADVLSVAMLGNTLTLGALLNLSSSIPAGSNGMTTSQLGERVASLPITDLHAVVVAVVAAMLAERISAISSR